MPSWKANKHFLAICLLSVSSAAFAGPHDVINEPEEPRGQLQPHHQLHEPTPPKAIPEPPTPPQEDVTIDSASGISVGTMLPSYESIGIVSPQESIFASNVWQYLTMDEALTLLDGLPHTISSHSLRNQIHTLLSLNATPPRHANNGWLLARNDALSHIGYTDIAATLLSAVSQPERSDALLASLITRYLQLSQADMACDAYQSHPLTLESSEQWQRLELFCDAVNEDYNKAELAISLKREGGNDYPAWLSSLVESLQYPNSRITLPDTHLKGMDRYMMLYAGESRLPESMDISQFLNEAETHHAIALNERFRPITRIPFMEAIASRTESGAVLESLYEQLSNMKVEEHEASILKRALAFQELEEARTSNQAIALIGVVLNRFKNADLSALSRQLLVRPIKALSARDDKHPSYVSYAPSAYRIMMEAREYGSADYWLNMMDIHRTDNITTYVAHELARFAENNTDSISPEAQEFPPFALPEEASENELRMLAHFYDVIEMFGYTPPSITRELIYERLKDSPQFPDNASAPITYAKSGNLAGMLLSAASQMGDNSLEEVPTSTRLSVISSLQILQQNAFAKDFAIESILAYF